MSFATSQGYSVEWARSARAVREMLLGEAVHRIAELLLLGR